MDDPLSRQILAAMARSSTWGHPDEFGEYTGMNYYANGNYAKAMTRFLDSARYADKLSQLCIGLMYLNGEGVAKDPVAAYAWVAIAAERNFPQFVATRDAIWNQLDAGQRERARALQDTLYAPYGDPVAKPRIIRELRMARAETIDHYLGIPTMTIAPGGPAPPCGGNTIYGAPIAGCSGDFYAAWRWQPELYFKVRDSVWTGTVSVGDVQAIKDPGSGH
ncbi:sel1 repeat family protein [Dyella soli]|uniref:Sel1 repeat family protein n=2 Tax=Dyella soli TaxID=522319 RepID=A0A4V2NM35_9GAMM|nr:sel1 repeat family protein [Dyella soli]